MNLDTLQEKIESGEVTKQAKITVTNNCGSCDFVVLASGGKKPFCGHRKLGASRPYSQQKMVVLNIIPEWCPL